MASAIIHICVAKKLNEKLNRNPKLFYLGAIAPDLSKQVGETKINSHFLYNTREDVPNIDMFLEKYKSELNKDFELGYFVHLYTDKMWFDGFIDNLVSENNIKLLDGTIVQVKPDEVLTYIYNDYTSLCVSLIDKYNLDLSLFYEEFDYPESIISEIPIDKLNIIVEKMGIIIENSKKEMEYIFDIHSITDFIENCTDEIYEFLIKENII